MHIIKHLRRRALTWAVAGAAATAVASALSLTAASSAPVTSAAGQDGAFTFALVPSPGARLSPAPWPVQKDGNPSGRPIAPPPPRG